MKKCYLFTEQFPYAKGEETFLEHEIPELAKNFELIIISSVDNKKVACEEAWQYDFLPKNVKIYNYLEKKASVWEYLKGFFFFFVGKDFAKERKEIFDKKSKTKLKKICKSVSTFVLAELFEKYLTQKKFFSPSEGDICYSYWYTYKVLGIIRFKEKIKNDKIRVVTRAHGYDLYDERVLKGGRQPFVSYMNQKLDKVFFISNQGYRYYLDKVGSKYVGKCHVFRIGVPGGTFNNSNTQQKTKFQTIVSCSSLIELKRVSLIIDALSNIDDYYIRWVHFGDGELKENLCSYANAKLNEKDNISYEFKGHVNRKEIYDFYRNEEVTLFVTTSASEGSPVSIQEALAFGLPILATNVGGIAEMISENGVLLSSNPDSYEVAEALSSFFSLSEIQRQRMRINSFKIWEEYFDGKKNANLFCNMLLELSESKEASVC